MQHGGFFLDGHLIQLLQAQVGLHVFARETALDATSLIVKAGGTAHILVLRAGEGAVAVGQFAVNLFALPFEVNFMQLAEHMLLAFESLGGGRAGFLEISLLLLGLFELGDDGLHFGFAQGLEHLAEFLKRIEVVPFEAVVFVLSDH